VNNRTFGTKEKVTPLSNFNIMLPAYPECKHRNTHPANGSLANTALRLTRHIFTKAQSSIPHPDKIPLCIRGRL